MKNLKYDKTQAKRQAKRRAALNKAAQDMGYTSWSAYETAVINGSSPQPLPATL